MCFKNIYTKFNVDTLLYRESISTDDLIKLGRVYAINISETACDKFNALEILKEVGQEFII